MDTEEKKLTSSEIEAMLKEAETVHEQGRTLSNRNGNRKSPRKKRSHVRIDMIIAVIVAVALITGVVLLIVHFSKSGNSSSDKVVTENPLMDEKYPEISDVVKNYLNAYLIDDAQERLAILAQYVDNMGDTNEGDIVQNKHVENYSDIECYTKEGPYENTYVVYAYYHMEFKNISTTAPGITTLYVIRDSKTGSVYIHNGISSDVKKYISDVSKDADVQNLLNDVNKEYREALESDSRLKDFFSKMEQAKETTTAIEETTTGEQVTTKQAETTK